MLSGDRYLNNTPFLTKQYNGLSRVREGVVRKRCMPTQTVQITQAILIMLTDILCIDIFYDVVIHGITFAITLMRLGIFKCHL
jgi:hypothetical protein